MDLIILTAVWLKQRAQGSGVTIGHPETEYALEMLLMSLARPQMTHRV